MSKLGDGSRFAAGAEKIEKKEGLSKARAAAIMAVQGAKKYGQKKMSAWAAAGRHKATK